LAGLNTPQGLQGYAIGGAMTNDANYTDPRAPGMQQQVSEYLSSTGGAADSNALYVVWGGPNDFSNAIATNTLSSATAANAVSNLSGYVSTLVGAGARRFLVPNIPNLSLTPNARLAAAQIDAFSPGSGASFLAGLNALS